MKYTTGWEPNGKKQPFYEKGMGPSFPDFPHWLSFPMLWEIDEKTHAFPM